MDSGDGLLMIIPILSSYATLLPQYLIWIVGLVFAFRFREYHPRSAFYVIIGLSICLVSSLILTPINILLPVWVMGSGSSASQLGLYFSGLSLLHAIIDAVAWGLIVAALVSLWRGYAGSDF